MDALTSNVLRLLGVLTLVLMNGFFVAAELALIRIRDTQLEPLVLKGHRRARIVRQLIQNLDATIGAIQFGITLASLGLGVLVEPVFESLLAPVFVTLNVQSEAVRHTVAIAFGFFINLFLLVVVGELGPKAVAIRKTLPVALWTSQPLLWFARITHPFVWLLHHSAQWLLRRLGIEPASEGDRAHSEEELRLLFATAQRQTGGTRLGRDIVLNALDLRRRIVREVMRPRQESSASTRRPASPNAWMWRRKHVFRASHCAKPVTLTARWGWCISRICSPCGSRRGRARISRRWRGS